MSATNYATDGSITLAAFREATAGMPGDTPLLIPGLRAVHITDGEHGRVEFVTALPEGAGPGTDG